MENQYILMAEDELEETVLSNLMKEVAVEAKEKSYSSKEAVTRADSAGNREG